MIYHLYILFSEITARLLCPLSNWIVCLLMLSFESDILVFCWICHLQIFLSTCSISFNPLHRVLHRAKLFFFLLCWWYVEVPGQGSNLHHSSDLSYSSDNTRSLTCCIARELPWFKFWWGPIYPFFLLWIMLLCLALEPEDFLPESFIVLCLTFKSMIHFTLIFVRFGSRLKFCLWMSNVPSTIH